MSLLSELKSWRDVRFYQYFAPSGAREPPKIPTLRGAGALWAAGDVLLKGAVQATRGTSPIPPSRGNNILDSVVSDFNSDTKLTAKFFTQPQVPPPVYQIYL